MAQDRKYYEFKSVGELRETFDKRIEVVAEKLPLSISTPIKMSDKSSSVFSMHTDHVKMIRDNLRNLIMTNHGERLMMADFGANIKELIFELGNEDADTAIMERISSAVGKFMPHVSLTGYEPIRKIGSSGNVDRLVIRVTFSIPMMNLSDIALEILVYEAG